MTNNTARKALIGPCVMLINSNHQTLANDNPQRQEVHNALLKTRDLLLKACEWEETHNAGQSMLSAEQVDEANHRLRLSLDPQYRSMCEGEEDTDG